MYHQHGAKKKLNQIKNTQSMIPMKEGLIHSSHLYDSFLYYKHTHDALYFVHNIFIWCEW